MSGPGSGPRPPVTLSADDAAGSAPRAGAAHPATQELARSRGALTTLAQRYQELFLAVPWPMVITDADGAVLARNRAAAERTKIPVPSGGAERSVVTAFVAADRPRARSLVVKVIAHGHPLEARLRLRLRKPPPGGPPSEAAALEMPVMVRLTPFTDYGEAAVRLSWDLRPATAPAPPAASPARRVARESGAGDPARFKDALDHLLRLQSESPRPPFEADVIAEQYACRAVAVLGADRCTVTVLDDDGAWRTLGASDGLAAELDAVQRDIGQGPTVSALSSSAVVSTGEVATFWPIFVERCSEASVRSAVSVQFPVNRGLRAAVTAWSGTPNAFGATAELLLPVLASQLALALQYADKVANLQRALVSRQVIGQACGVLMERHRLPSEVAFQRLVETSQRHHTKINWLAEQVLETGRDLDDLCGPSDADGETVDRLCEPSL
jgi:hypothetical protein